MDISVFGLGYVGCVSMACLAASGHSVIGVDINEAKVNLINQGGCPIVEKGLDELIAEQRLKGRLSATTDASEAVRQTEVSFISVGTPPQTTGHLDHSAVFRVIEDIAQGLKEKDTFHIIAIRSTVFPGTAEKAICLLQEISGKSKGTDFSLVINPEFLREGSALEDYYSPPYTLVGGDDQRALETFRQIYAEIQAPFITCDFKTAEMIKHVSNAFHALKITFANEVGQICKGLGVDSHRLMEIFCLDRKLNLSPYYLKPGFAYGGSCLPKDLKALNILAHDLYVETPVLANIEKSNELQKERLLRIIISLDKKKLGFLGLSFKAGTDDLRNSPIVDVIEKLIGKGYDIKIYDRNVSLAALMGANRDFILKRIPVIAELLCPKIEEVEKFAEVLIVVNKEKEFEELLDRTKPEITIIDLVNFPCVSKGTLGNYIGYAW